MDIHITEQNIHVVKTDEGYLNTIEKIKRKVDIKIPTDYKNKFIVVINMDLDLDIVNGKQATIKLFGRDIRFRDLLVQEYLEAEFLIQELDQVPMVDKESIEHGASIIHKYISIILEIDIEEAKQVSIAQFRALRTFMARKDMYDQGFSDKEIDALEKKALKKQAAQILK